MVPRRSMLVAALLLVGLVAGCTTQQGSVDDADGAPTTVYTHRWSYGPSYGGGNGLPVFEDVFETTADTGELTVRIDWRIDQGKAAVELTSPGGASVNWTSTETGGPQGQGEETIAAEDGTWEIRIPTWRGADGSSPSGHVEVRVVD